MELIIHFTALPEKLTLDMVKSDLAELLEDDDEKRLLRGIVRRLPEKEQQLMVQRFGLFGARVHTQKQLADQMGISQSYISRLEKRILSKIRKEMQRECAKS